ncbi:EamA family transporter [Pseudomonas trivialis]|uniref:EamA-like transporter family protein n=1 Tax=Pseudomonas trivialis TaxID=200450 RepID=A0A0R2ZR96_9PSED|nr:EamA family transporter [Pseudomonas trivialis]KRP63170.1 membrane protein [Pseudomonas trivialis]SDR98252.1 EamA-like transporter family protein [Pseudomonas trivialis]
MSQLTFILWILNVIVDTSGQLAFKAAATNSAEFSGMAHWRHMLARHWFWIGIGLYVIEFVLWLAFLSLVPLSVAVMLGSFNIVVIMIAGRLWFKESLTKWRLIGILLIALGTVVVGFG